MGKYSFFKIKGEIEENIDLGDDTLDNTPEYILHVETPMYADEFESLVISFGRPMNTQDDFDQFIMWLNKKSIKADYTDFYFIDNYNEAKMKRQRLKNLEEHLKNTPPDHDLADAIEKGRSNK